MGIRPRRSCISRSTTVMRMATPKVLDVLKEKKVPAIFFVTGHYIKDQPELVKRMAAEGRLVGNHSWSHPDMSGISSGQIASELSKVKSGAAQLTGGQQMQYLRPPRGIFSDHVLAVSKQEGYTSVFWWVHIKTGIRRRSVGGSMLMTALLSSFILVL